MSSSPKQYNLPPSTIIPTQAVSGNITSKATNIFYKDNVGIQLVWTGTVNGSFAVQVSLDYVPDTGIGTWTAITLSPSPAASGSPGNWFIDLQGISGTFIRTVFTYSSGSGNLTGTITGKAV